MSHQRYTTYTPIFPNDLISCKSTKPLTEFERTVTLQAQREYPPDMQCKDKFLLQSTIVPPNTDVDDFPADTFNKESSKDIRECKLKVQYISPSAQGNSGDEGSSDSNSLTRKCKPGIQFLSLHLLNFLSLSMN
ncbi:hypothetical protein ES332_A09G226600v1 [Gossypium tomentosum]|uniref:MSP domain-containing protein n=1 Tax=Gossypium tomentosum TaxID=34277 RepID=A0A5D2P644_GOSTO|nr:hypothetical protein ES332_A09G226600v1 [Gossypium tomentosum]TYI11720.1 hypothetical protein ES332_A09G226600v1 [Gossypium tomentosum]